MQSCITPPRAKGGSDVPPKPDRRTKLQPGDWVEWTPCGTWLRGLEAYAEQVGEVTEVHGRVAMVRYADGAEHRLNIHHLTWVPRPEQIADARDDIDREHLAYMRSITWLVEQRPGNPHTAPEGPYRHGREGR